MSGRKLVWIVSTSSLLLFVSAAGLAALDISVQESETLRVMEGISFEITGTTSEAEKDGLSTRQLEPDLKSKLEKAGLEIGRSNLQAYLVLNLEAFKTSIASDVYATDVCLYQPAELKRNKVDVDMVSWKRAMVGVAEASALQPIREHAEELIEEFIRSYLRVN